MFTTTKLLGIFTILTILLLVAAQCSAQPAEPAASTVESVATEESNEVIAAEQATEAEEHATKRMSTPLKEQRKLAKTMGMKKTQSMGQTQPQNLLPFLWALVKSSKLSRPTALWPIWSKMWVAT